MRGSILVVAGLSIAAPALAIVPHLVMPATYRGMDYVDVRCEGGRDSPLEIVRMQADGKLLRLTRASGLLAGSTTRAEAGRILRLLDRTRFGQRGVPRATSRMPGALDCTLIRGGHGKIDVLALAQDVRAMPRMHDVSVVLDQVRALGKRAVRPVEMSDDGRLVERTK